MPEPPCYDPPAPKPPLYFDAVLRPHRSLSPAGFLVLMAFISAICCTAGVVFMLMGAWPVCGFLGLEVLLIYIAFRQSYLGALLNEEVRLSDRELMVRRRMPDGEARVWRFHPFWVRVGMDEASHGSGNLTLSSHGRRLRIGAFLAPAERRALAQALGAALERQRLDAQPG